MKLRTFLLSALLLPISAEVVWAQSAGPVTISPAAPRRGQTVTITYDPRHPEAKLTGTGTVELVWRHYTPPQPIIQPMTRQNGVWTATLSLTDERIRYVGFSFQADSLTDTGQGRYWSFTVLGSDGRPVRGAHLARAFFNKYDRYRAAPAARKDSSAMAAYRAELALYPDNVEARAELAKLEAQAADDPDAVRAEALAAVRAAEQRARTAAELRSVQAAYRILGADSSSMAVRDRIAATFPRSGEAEEAAWRAIDAAKTPEEKQRLREAFLETFPGSVLANFIVRPLLMSYAEARDADRILGVGRRWIVTERHNPPAAYSGVAAALLEAGGHLDSAAAYARRAMDLHRVGWDGFMFFPTDVGVTLIPALYPPHRREPAYAVRRARYQATLGRVLLARGQTAEGLAELRTAAAVLKTDALTQRHLAEAYVQAAQPDSALIAYERALLLKPVDATARQGFTRLYVRQRGPDAAPALRDIAARHLARNRVDLAVPDFEITTLDGRPVTSASLRGKVVIVDLWATWCSPCIAAFPAVQAAYDQYKDHPEVAFLILNTSQNEDTREKAQRFASTNTFTFPYYYDEGARLTTALGVSAIPTTLVIGRDGRIRYKNTGMGSETPAEYAEYMKLKVDLLLNERVGGQP
ncbi:MAG TPA: redoxin family protein [Rhodothermales bacterium]|nr:redoxin family protein [Rhodothermales bacterium]